MSLIHEFPCNAAWTVRPFWERLFTATTSSGALSATECPSNHGSVQNRVDIPLPTVHRVEARKNAVVAASSECHADRMQPSVICFFLCFQSHLSQSALPMLSRSGIPSPPANNERWTWFQATEHLPPCATSVPIQRNPLINLIRALRTQARSSKLIAVWIGTTDKVDLIRYSLPDLCMRLPFQTESLSATLSIK
jgi:hypothetical protein